MGALHKGACYPSEAEAQAQACSSVFSFAAGGGAVYSAECQGVTAGAMDICKRTDGGTCVMVSQPLPPFPACSFDAPASIASEYFGVVLSFVVVVWLGSRIFRIFWKNHEAV